MSERDAGRIPVERWWPPLSIEAKHRVLAAMEAAEDDAEVTLDEELVAEIGAAGRGAAGGGAATGGEAPTRLTRQERDYIRTQIEPVD